MLMVFGSIGSILLNVAMALIAEPSIFPARVYIVNNQLASRSVQQVHHTSAQKMGLSLSTKIFALAASYAVGPVPTVRANMMAMRA
tara:strand:+ start:910 stop:1167 length:258 start_codon:yes stop_codon:yes gene_type:complete